MLYGITYTNVLYRVLCSPGISDSIRHFGNRGDVKPVATKSVEIKVFVEFYFDLFCVV